jgi:hypothetical protein
MHSPLFVRNGQELETIPNTQLKGSGLANVALGYRFDQRCVLDARRAGLEETREQYQQAWKYEGT